MNTARLLALFILFVGCAQCFTWDFVVAVEKQLQFYLNGKTTHIKEIPSVNSIRSITYDPVNNRVLFADTISIYSLNLRTMTVHPLIKENTSTIRRIAYDPVKNLLFWKENTNIYVTSLSLHPVFNKGNLIATSKNFCRDIAVDSCEGYIYWITNNEIERARFDGSKREVLINSAVSQRLSLAIDQPAQQMYWVEETDGISVNLSIVRANLTGNVRQETFTVISDDIKHVNSLSVTKDFIYYRSKDQKVIGQLTKKVEDKSKETNRVQGYTIPTGDCSSCQVIAANYAIAEQAEGTNQCDVLKRIYYEELLCVHGSRGYDGSHCICAKGYTGKRCEVDSCHNYCFNGDCSINDEGLPLLRCSCNAGYTGEKCQVYVCTNYCLNSGDCNLGEHDKPVCSCSKGYSGERCEVDLITAHTCTTNKQHIQDLKDLQATIDQKLQNAEKISL